MEGRTDFDLETGSWATSGRQALEWGRNKQDMGIVETVWSPSFQHSGINRGPAWETDSKLCHHFAWACVFAVQDPNHERVLSANLEDFVQQYTHWVAKLVWIICPTILD